MYHPYLNLEAKRIMVERRAAADLARRAERAQSARPDLLSRVRSKLAAHAGHSGVHAGKRADSARRGAFDSPLSVVTEE